MFVLVAKDKGRTRPYNRILCLEPGLSMSVVT